jgi:stalled ribosome alternative rescue factor ArfA
MNTAPKKIDAKKGKGSYRRKLRHSKKIEEDRG